MRRLFSRAARAEVPPSSIGGDETGLGSAAATRATTPEGIAAGERGGFGALGLDEIGREETEGYWLVGVGLSFGLCHFGSEPNGKHAPQLVHCI